MTARMIRLRALAIAIVGCGFLTVPLVALALEGTDVTDDERTVIADWLVAVGYPFDWSTPDNPLPERLRLPLAEAWFRHDGIDGETIDDYLDSLEAEGAW